MDLTRLQELKQKLLNDKELAPVWGFFFDHFAEDPEFIALGQRTRHAFVEAVLAQVGPQMFPGAGPASGLLLTRLADQQFIHGGFFLGGRPGGVIYYEDARVGLITVANLPPSTEVKYARFSGMPLRGLQTPSRN
jgi:hypothetical protein